MGRRTLLLALVALSACLRAPPPVKPIPIADPNALTPAVEKAFVEAKAVVHAQDALVWASWTQGTPMELSKAHEGHEALFSLETYRAVDQALSQAREGKAAAARSRELEHLRAFLAGEYLARGLTEQHGTLANLEASMTFSVAGSEQRFRELPRLLSTEKSALRRRALYAGATESYERLNQSLRRKEERTAALITELGFASYEDCAGALQGTDPEKMGELANSVLTATEAPYRETLERLASDDLGLPREKLQRADLLRMFRGPSMDEAFAAKELFPRAKATFAALGIDLGAVPGLTLELSDGPKKSHRPLTVALEIPGDVRTSLRLRGGVQSQASLFHELGHALFHSFTRPMPFALSRLGSGALPEAYAFLLESLVEEPAWLATHAGLSKAQLAALTRPAAARRLFLVRRNAGRLLYQLAARASPEADLEALYDLHLGRAYGLSATADDRARHLTELEDFFQSANDLRGWVLAGLLRKELTSRFGGNWWERAEAGAWLKSLWADGNSRSPEELAGSLGANELVAAPAIEQLAAALGSAPP